MPECWDRNVRFDQLNQRPVGGEGRQVRVDAVADMGRIGVVVGRSSRLVGRRRTGDLDRSDRDVAIVSLGHQRFPHRAQKSERGGNGADPAQLKPGPLAHGQQYGHSRAVM